MTEPATTACQVTVADIQRAVAHCYGVSVADLRSSRRAPETVQPRFIAIYLAQILTPLTASAIGRLFGDRDHSAILRAIKMIQVRLGKDPTLADEFEMLKAEACRHAGSVWRSRMPGDVLTFDQTLNQFGFELAIVPIGTRDHNGFAPTRGRKASTGE
ncbi:helix-turn-helix domain-containing protein [Bradyrhizobium sp. 31Argb]|uniref:helix-turn-helix domain-containing protein n=1 Tax=Bradyrhizobium sp. 31Argb TaxID=3141247 RepID=UPI0037493D1F